MTLDCLRIGKEIGMKSGFLPKEGGRHCFILASDKNKKDQKSLQSKLLLIIIIAHKQRTLKHEILLTKQIKIQQSQSTNQDLLNSCK